jgi:hypothetical protein
MRAAFQRPCSHLHWRRSAALPVIAGAVLGPVATASAQEPVNVTLNIPADVRPNPCAPYDFVNLSGTLHIVYYVRSDGQGGFHLDQLVSEQATGTSLTTGDAYQASDTEDTSWYTSPPFPSTTTHVHQVGLVSRGAADNFLMRYRLHTTLTMGGVPTAAVDAVELDCTG